MEESTSRRTGITIVANDNFYKLIISKCLYYRFICCYGNLLVMLYSNDNTGSTNFAVYDIYYRQCVIEIFCGINTHPLP